MVGSGKAADRRGESVGPTADLEPCLCIGGDGAIHEVEKFLAATAFLVCGPDPAGGNLKGGKQGCRAMPLIVVALPGQARPFGSFK
jgi:hypothetical protein